MSTGKLSGVCKSVRETWLKPLQRKLERNHQYKSALKPVHIIIIIQTDAKPARNLHFNQNVKSNDIRTTICDNSKLWRQQPVTNTPSVQKLVQKQSQTTIVQYWCNELLLKP